MKTYKVYNFDFFDESIEENNSAFTVLSLKSKEEAEKMESDNDVNRTYCWFSGTSQMTIENICKYVWSKEDIDNFVEDNPECALETYNIHNIDSSVEYRNWCIKYTPIQYRRDLLIEQIIG